MVNVELDLKGIIGLAISDAIDKKQLKEYLEKFDKKDFIKHIIEESIIEVDIPEGTEEPKDADPYK